ncbi:hypothetical protein [Oricola thermophila]|uniref:Uncharacterized protein n=1 Tax=Oricola thermophila TaxID=2742145 RepID=A0A6N1VCR9_9HYPH|nr:hypothetical protein [Oricola thermophila]QKV17365.1 hypothetical protein HTY61_02235 [Oricola thermophila]
MKNPVSRRFHALISAANGKTNSGMGSQISGIDRPKDGHRRTLLPAHLLVLR